MAVQEKVQEAGISLDYLSLHRIRRALQIILASTDEPNPEYSGMKIRAEVRFINSLLSNAVHPCEK